MRKLGQYTAERHYALVKLDLEGYEYSALKGTEASLAEGNPRVLLLEVLPRLLERAGGSVPELTSLLRRHHYETFVYEPRSGVTVIGDPDTKGNVLAIHRDALAAVRQRVTSDHG
jgi:hypothetical protein